MAIPMVLCRFLVRFGGSAIHNISVIALDLPSIGIGALASVTLAAILGSGWRWVSGTVIERISRRQEIRGTWYQVIAEYENAPERVDQVEVRQRGQRISGSVKRLYPTTRKGKWRFAGYVHGNAVVCVFFTTSPKDDPTSYGAINLHRDPANPGAVYRGYYTRPDFEAYDRFVGPGLSRRALTWQRVDPDIERC